MAEQQSPAEEENNILRDELERVEGILSGCRKECNIIGTKYQELSDKMEDILKLQSEDTDQDDSLTNELVEHHKELRQNLEEELNKYRQHVSSYQNSQAVQSKMIDELHNKVEEYRIRCAKLEAALAENSTQVLPQEPGTSDLNDNAIDLETALIKLEQEKNRCHGLTRINSLLREQLETATEANQVLTADIHRLMEEWQCTREELDAKEIEWKDEERSFSDYFTKEHHRLLSLWRQLLHFRHEFAKMRRSTEQDLTQVRTQLNQASQNVSQMCLRLRPPPPSDQNEGSWSLQIQQLNQDMISMKVKCESEKAELHERICTLETSNDHNEALLREKDQMICQLQRTVEAMEGASIDGSPSKNRHSVKHHEEELRQYQRAIRDIAQAVCDDFNHDTWIKLKRAGVPDVGCLQLPGAPSSPNYLRGTVSSTVSAFHSRRLLAEEIYKMFKEQKDLAERSEENDAGINRLQQFSSNLSSRLDTMQGDIQGLMQDHHGIQVAIQGADDQKILFQKQTRGMQEHISSLTAENEKLRQMYEDLDQRYEVVEGERDRLRAVEKRALRDLEKSGSQIVTLKEKLEIQTKEAQTYLENLQKLSLDNDILQQEKNRYAQTVKKLEGRYSSVQEQVAKIRVQEQTLTNGLGTMKNNHDMLQQSNADLQNCLVEVEEQLKASESMHLNEKAAFEKEKQVMKERIEKLQRYSQELEVERNILKDTLQATETSKHDADEEKTKLLIVNNDLLNQITKLKNQKKILEEEQQHLRKELGRQMENCEKTNLENANLAREKAELLVRAETAEKEVEFLSVTESMLREEKEGLEKSLYDYQHSCEMHYSKIEELERELENERSRVLSLQEAVSVMRNHKELDAETAARQKDALSQKIQQLEQEYRAVLQNERRQHKIDLGMFSQEKESQFSRLEAAQEDLVKTVQKHQEELIASHEREIADLRSQMMSQQLEFEEKLMIFETEQKKAATTANLSISSLQQKLREAQRDLSDNQSTSEEAKRKHSTSVDHCNSIISQLQDEVTRLKEEIKSNAISHEKSLKEVNNQLIEVKQQRDSALEEIGQLQVQVDHSGKECESLRLEVKELTASKENAKKIQEQLEEQLSDFNLRLSSEKGQTEMEKRSSEEFKNRFKKLQMEYNDLVRFYEDTRSKLEAAENANNLCKKHSDDLKTTLHEVEQSRLDGKREINNLRRQLSNLDAALHSKNREIADMRSFQEREEEKEVGMRKEISSLRQKLMESEASHEAGSKELAYAKQKLADYEHKFKLRLEEHQTALHESLSTERSLTEMRASLERSLADSMKEIQQLRLKLSFSEGKCKALESKATKLEGAKREVENKLHQLYMTLRVTLGLGNDSGFAGSSHLPLSPWSSRRGSPVKGGDRSYRESTPIRDSGSKAGSPVRQDATLNISDLDIDLVKSALQDLVQKLFTVEKERDDFKSEVMKYQRQLDKYELEANDKTSALHSVRQDIQEIRNEKKAVENELGTLKALHQHQGVTIQTLEREQQVLMGKISRLEQNVTSLTSEKRRLQESLTQVKKAEVKASNEKQSLIDAAESRAAKSDFAIRACESEKNQLQNALILKESEVQILQQKLDEANRNLRSLDTVNGDYQMTINKLNMTAQKYADSETQLKEKVQALTKSLSESSAAVFSMEEELSTVKKSLSINQKENAGLQHSVEKLS